MTAYWTLIFHQLIWAFAHLQFGHGLYLYYIGHHAVAFLHSGYTSGSGGRGYVYWLAQHHVGPVDW